MPSRDWQLRIQDILESIAEIEQRTRGMTFAEFEKNSTMIKSVLYDFIIIGEATKNAPDEIQSCYPLIPWHLMRGMHNVTTHEYFQVNLSRIWTTIQEDLLPLVPQLQATYIHKAAIEIGSVIIFYSHELQILNIL